VNPSLAVLLVDGDRHFAAALARELIADGFEVALADDAERARALARERPPRLMLLGRLERRQATALLEELRRSEAGPHAWSRALAIVVLGLEAGGLEALRAFEAGADDYLARPFNYLELRARIGAILRRIPERPPGAVLELGSLQIDPSSARAALDGHLLALSRTEFALLAHLAGEPERVFAREELLRLVWGYRCAGATRTVDTHASRLRGKLLAASGERWITGVRGIGYRLR
jgi:DNA-binding response OmpR family regulator